MKLNGRSTGLESRPWFLAVTVACFLVGVLLASFVRLDFDVGSRLCSLSAASASAGAKPTDNSRQIQAIIHYATTTIVPQQSLAEISVTYRVIQSYGPNRPFNFLIFGLGHDSLMWDSLNPLGTTTFLEEDPKWLQTVLKDRPNLHAHHIKYRTQLQQADELLASYRTEPRCEPGQAAQLKGNTACRLALENLPDEIYETEWDLIMIDAPKGYFAEAPGRMGAIFSMAVMARGRRGPGPTHVFLHDVDRRVEKMFAEEFLCRKYLVEEVGRLWHFVIPSAYSVDAANASRLAGAVQGGSGGGFCYVGRDGNSKANLIRRAYDTRVVLWNLATQKDEKLGIDKALKKFRT